MPTATTDRKRIGAAVKKRRLDNGWSQPDLADAAKVSVRTIQSIEAGGPAKELTYSRIARAFEMTLDTLLNGGQ